MAVEITLAGIAGALVAILVLALVDPNGELTHLHAAGIAAGIFAGIGLDRLLRG